MTIFKLTSRMMVTAAFIVAVLPLNVFAISSTHSNDTSTTEASEKTQTKTQTVPTAEEKMSEQKQALKCQAIAEIGKKIKEQQSQRGAEVESKRTKVQKSTVDRQDDREKMLAVKRAEWDTHRQDNFTKLRTKATTDSQKIAVELYIKTVTAAILKHRASNDVAFAEFRAAVTALKSGVSQSVKTNITNSSVQVDAAIAAAKTACANGQSADSVKQSLRTQLQTIRSESKQGRESINISQGMKEIVQKRKEAVKASASVFKASTQQGREMLLATFKEDTKKVE